MTHRTHGRIERAILLGCASGLLLAATAPAQEAEPAFEAQRTLSASDVVPDELLKGPDFTLDPVVHNDGFMNRYRLRTTWGELDVVSTPLLRKRVRETYALRRIEETSKSGEFAKSVGQAGKGTVTGAKNLVTHPVDSVSGAVSGVGKMFGIAKDSATSDDRSDAEDARWASAVGFSQSKRNLAKELGVDVYTRNPLLQKALDDLSWASWGGGTTGGLALAAVPGGVGVAVSVSKNSDLFNRIDVSKPPGEVRKHNRRKLAAMGMPQAAIDRFVGDSKLSPTQQSLIVVALEDLGKTSGRGWFLDFAARAPDADVVGFAVLQALMYAKYDGSQERIARFEGIGPRVVARTSDQGVVVIHPTDHLFWTEAASGILSGVDPKLTDAPRKLLWVGGRTSETARKAMEARGWEVREGALDALLGKRAGLD